MNGTPDPAQVLSAIGWEANGPFEPVTTGWANHLWRFRTADGREHALRMARVQGDAASARRVAAREIAATQALHELGLPAPAIEARGEFEDAPFMVQQWLPGRPVMDVVASKPWRIWQLGRAYGRLQAQLHRFAPEGVPMLDPATDLAHIGDPALLAALEKRSRAKAFCHLDLHPLNVLAEGARISGIVDFANARIADPRLDLALTFAFIKYVPAPSGRLDPVLSFVRDTFARAWRSGYREAGGEFRLERLFVAAALAWQLADSRKAIREGRGWATEESLRPLAARLVRVRAMAGL